MTEALVEDDFELFGSSKPDGQDTTASEWQQTEGVFSTFEHETNGLVHVGVGGLMNGITTTALDPLFWLHRSNIDRIWVMWNARGHRNPTDPLWLDMTLRDFVTSDGTPYGLRVRDLQDTSALGYRY